MTLYGVRFVSGVSLLSIILCSGLWLCDLRKRDGSRQSKGETEWDDSGRKENRGKADCNLISSSLMTYNYLINVQYQGGCLILSGR